MNFSIILASRERVALLDGLLNSIARTTRDAANCEVLVVIDSDDSATKRQTNRLSKSCPFARIIVRDRAGNLNNDYLNWAWRHHSSGKNIIICNDDCLFKTDGWDAILSAKLNGYFADKPDGIAYGWISDALEERAHGMGYCCFPLVTRAAADTVGFVMPPEYRGWGADIALWRIYNSASRVCDLSEMMIEHVSYHSKTHKRSRDHISHYVEQISAGCIHPICAYDPSPHVHKINAAVVHSKKYL